MAQSAASPRTRLGHDERRQAIVRAAADVFARRDYETVSTAELAHAAGISRGLLNHYFRTKRELYVAVVEGLFDLPDLPVPAYFEGATVEDRIRESVHDWLDLVERRAAAWLVATAVATSGPPEARQIVDRSVERVVTRILEVAGLSRAAEGREDMRAALRGYAEFASGLAHDWLEHRRLNRAQVELLLGGVLINLVRELLPALADLSTARKPAKQKA
jgi:AcrR family transcriptional regulator